MKKILGLVLIVPILVSCLGFYIPSSSNTGSDDFYDDFYSDNYDDDYDSGNNNGDYYDYGDYQDNENNNDNYDYYQSPNNEDPFAEDESNSNEYTDDDYYGVDNPEYYSNIYHALENLSLPDMDRFEAGMEYDLELSVYPEANDWSIILYAREDSHGGRFIPIDFSGNGTVRSRKFRTYNYLPNTQIDYYWQIYIPSTDQEFIYGNPYLQLKIVSGGYDNNQNNDYNGVYDALDHLQLPTLHEFESGRYYDLDLYTDRVSENWEIVLFVKESNSGNRYIPVNFTGYDHIKEGRLSTHNYNDYSRVNYYWNIYIPETGQEFQYESNRSLSFTVIPGYNDVEPDDDPDYDYDDIREMLGFQYISDAYLNQPIYINIPGSFATSGWKLRFSYKKYSRNNWTPVQLREENNHFVGEFELSHRQFDVNDLVDYKYEVLIPGTTRGWQEVAGGDFPILSSEPMGFSDYDIKQLVEFPRMPDVDYENQPSTGSISCAPEADGWLVTVHHRLSGSRRSYNQGDTIRVVSNGYQSMNIETYNYEQGDQVEYYFSIEIGDTQQYVEIYKDDPKYFNVAVREFSIEDYFEIDPIPEVLRGEDFEIAMVALRGIQIRDYSCEVYYRYRNYGQFWPIEMNRRGNMFIGTIPKPPTEDLYEIQYYFVLTKNDGTTSNYRTLMNPITVDIVDEYSFNNFNMRP